MAEIDCERDCDRSPSTRMPRAQAGFIIKSATWVMGALAALFTAVLGGTGWIIANQYRMIGEYASDREVLKQHGELLLKHDRMLIDHGSAIVTVSNLQTALSALKDVHAAGMDAVTRRADGLDARLQSHTHAIVTAEGLLNTLSAKLSDVAAGNAENKALHADINRRLDAIEERLKKPRRP